MFGLDFFALRNSINKARFAISTSVVPDTLFPFPHIDSTIMITSCFPSSLVEGMPPANEIVYDIGSLENHQFLWKLYEFNNLSDLFELGWRWPLGSKFVGRIRVNIIY